MLDLIDTLKQNQEDFEFYPTTDRMLDVIFNDIINNNLDKVINILDIGSGTCKIYNRYKDNIFNYYIIEKSKILIEKAPTEAVVVGTDFNNCTLVDKKVKYIFCNPPYSEFEEWTAKILEENYSKYIYLIIPSRWKDNNIINEIINNKKITYKILSTDNFLDGERQARANVDIVKFEMQSINIYNSEVKDPFCDWFDKNFKFNNIDDKEELDYFKREKEIEKLNELMVKKGSVEVLVENYNLEMQKLVNNFKILSSLDSDLLKTINCNISKLQEALQMKIKNLKIIHWKSLFNNLDTITKRLTIKSRENIFKKINDNLSVDFTYDNVYAIIIWIIKQSNKYYEKQLIEVFKELSDKCNCIKYKSNKSTWEEEKWRWNRNEVNNYILDYRIVLETYSYKWQNIISDIITIANNLNFNIMQFNNYYDNYNCEEKQEFGEICDVNGDLFISYKKYKNGNIHLKINQEFMKAFNIEVSRLLGWVKNKEDIKKEFNCNISDEDIKKYYKSYIGITKNSINNILLLK